MTVTLVTGANKGLGYETARQLIELGHTVYIGARNVERGQSAATELVAQFVHLEVSDDESVATAMSVIASREGHLDILVNNAGISTTDGRKRPGRAGGIRHQCDRHHPCHPGSTSAVGEVREPSCGQRLERAWFVLGRDQSEPTAVSLPFHYLRLEQSRRLNAHSSVRQSPARHQVQRGRAGLYRDRLTPFSGAGQPVDKGAEVIVRMAIIGKDGPTGTFQEGEEELGW